MIEWRDEALVLSARAHGESSALVQLLTREKGRHVGLVRGGQGRQKRPVLQTGNLVAVSWKARLSDHLGTYSLELVTGHAARFLDDPARLAVLASAAALCETLLPEREPHPACFEGFGALIEALPGDIWAEIYVHWELLLLRELGFGLNLETCAAGGDNAQLAYVSPKSGRAVSLAEGEPYKDRLLPLPPFLIGLSAGGRAEVSQGLHLTGHFLERHLFHPRDKQLPAARQRLQQRFFNQQDSTEDQA
jgi:DNA repair protein RecO (recombination protein O)|tara:strand:+ start:1285 stop:2028 length:744 start_codon:yes stop_codon:yes gene_type:complete